MFPETPRFAYRQGRVDEAKETMMRVYGAPAHHYAVHTQLEEIEAKLRAESQIKGNAVTEVVNMFKAPRMAYRIAIGVTLQMFQQLTGANYFFYVSYPQLGIESTNGTSTVQPSSNQSASTILSLRK